MTPLPLYRIRLTLLAPLGTKLTSGTLFGHLCWAVRDRDGEAGLTQWLGSQATAPWLISDGFPKGLLPRPLIRPSARRPSSASVHARTLAEADDEKKRRRRAWLRVDDFLKLRGDLSEDRLLPHLVETPWHTEEQRLAHNAIDRQTATTPESGGLFFVDEDWSFTEEPSRDIYVRTAADVEEVRSLFGWIGGWGYGRDATWGRGRFTVDRVEPVPTLDAATGNRRLSLSHGTLTTNMRNARYKLAPHFGKVGSEMAARLTRPWKLPLLLVRPGTTFQPVDAGPFGELLAGVHQERADILHDARHLVVPFNEVEATP